MLRNEGAQHARQPRVELISLDNLKMVFVLHGSDVSMANALRRIMISEVPTLAIDLVRMDENTSVHQDEFIAHRLGLLPIDSRNIRNFKFSSECNCAEACSNCSVNYTLDVQSTSPKAHNVTHLDLVPHGSNVPMPVPRLQDIKIPLGVTQAMANRNKRPADAPCSLPSAFTETYCAITIAKLALNQKIKAQCLAVKGIGKLHAKWNPCATAVFQHEPIITIDQNEQRNYSLSLKKELVASCPRKVFGLASAENEGGGNLYGYGNSGDVEDLDLAVVRPQDCIFCQECTAACTKLGARNFVKVEHGNNRFLFTVESTGVMPPEQIVTMSLEILEDKIQNVQDNFCKNPAAASALGLHGVANAPTGFSAPMLDLS